MANELTWHDVLAEEKQQPYFLNTLQTVASERQSGVTIYPPQKDVFNAFRFTELGDVKVVILGQDPYHGPGQAHGLAFSVRPGIATPPSLLIMSIAKYFNENLLYITVKIIIYLYLNPTVLGTSLCRCIISYRNILSTT